VLQLITRRLLILTCLATIVSGCVSNKSQEQTKPKSVYELNNWQAKGKLNISFQGKSQSAHFNWEHKGEDFTIHLHGPFGQGSVYLNKENGEYTLQDGGETHTEASPEALLYSQLGLQFPVSELLYWIRGVRAPDEHKGYTFLPVSNIQQKGWVINYTKQGVYDNYLLPEKMIAVRDNLKVTMVIKRWKLD